MVYHLRPRVRAYRNEETSDWRIGGIAGAYSLNYEDMSPKTWKEVNWRADLMERRVGNR
jgi:hypothetical protein